MSNSVDIEENDLQWGQLGEWVIVRTLSRMSNSEDTEENE
jgi:hypothetical protein